MIITLPFLALQYSQGEYMPKKKLTKKQVNVKMKRVRAALEDLLIDKTTKQQESFVPMSDTKLREFLKQFITAHVRLLRK